MGQTQAGCLHSCLASESKLWTARGGHLVYPLAHSQESMLPQSWGSHVLEPPAPQLSPGPQSPHLAIPEVQRGETPQTPANKAKDGH